MLVIKDNVNIGYETDNLMHRYFNDVLHYNERLEGTPLATSIDQCYIEAETSFREIESKYANAVDMIRFYYNLKNLFVASPFLDLFLKDVKKEDVKKRVYEFTKTSFEELDSKSYDGQSMYDMVNGVDIEDSQKWKLISMYENAEVIYDEYKKAIMLLSPYVEDLVDKNKNEIQNYISEWKALNKDGDLKVAEFFGITLLEGDFVLYPSIVGVNQGTFFQENIFLGLALTPEYKSKIPMTVSRATEVAKMISDPTKNSILSLLKEKTMYGKELASALKLTGATVSYHIQELLQNSCVTMEQVEGTNRTYYSINKEAIREALNVLKEEYK